MEKMRSIDGKLKHQIDRLMKLSVRGTSDSGSSSLRPNPLALLSKGGDDEDSDAEGEAAERAPKGGEFYRAPKMAAAPYKVHIRNSSCPRAFAILHGCPVLCVLYMSDESQSNAMLCHDLSSSEAMMRKGMELY
jgi:hypothetical protein